LPLSVPSLDTQIIVDVGAVLISGADGSRY